MTHPLIASIPTSGQTRPFPLTDHYNYPILDLLCSCAVCTEWRSTRLFLTSRGIFSHRRDCICAECLPTRKRRSAFIAAENRRILFCECSWHASSMNPPELGERFMRWLLATLQDRKARGDGWWELRGAGFSIAHWFVLFRHEVFGAAAVSQEEIEMLHVEAREVAALPQAAPITYAAVATGIATGIATAVATAVVASGAFRTNLPCSGRA